MIHTTEDSGTPWYLHSWPWFIVILLAVSVIASLATVVIAFKYRDADVRHADRATITEAAAPVATSRGD